MLTLGITVQMKEMLVLQKNLTLNSILQNSSENSLDRVKRHFEDLETDFDLNLIDNKTDEFFDLENFYEKLKFTNPSSDVISALGAITNDLEGQNASDNKPHFHAQETQKSGKVFKRDLEQQSNDHAEIDDEIVKFKFYIFKSEIARLIIVIYLNIIDT